MVEAAAVEVGTGSAVSVMRDSSVAVTPDSSLHPFYGCTMGAAMSPGRTDGRLSVLVVEDDPDLRVLVRAVLRDLAGEIDEATTGDEAMEKIVARPYDVVLLDLMLPRQNGFEVYKAIQQLPKRPRVIVVSAIARYFDDRFDDDVIVLQKPFTNEALVEAVRGTGTLH